MNTAAEEWTARVAARNEVEAAKAQAAMPAWVRRCRASRSAGALACCAVAIISCGHFPNYIAEMGDGSYRFVTPAMTRVFGAPSRVVVRRYLGCGDAVVLDNAEGRVALATLNDNLERVHGADIRKGGAE